MGPLLPNTGNKSQAIILVEHDQVLKYANFIPGVFNDLFFYPPGTLNTLSDFSSHLSVQKNHWKMASWKTVFFPTSRLSLNTENFERSRLRKISGRWRHFLLNSIAVCSGNRRRSAWLIKLINKLIGAIGHWNWKEVKSRVSSDDATDKKNYRPVSVLTTMAKLYEKVIYVQLHNSTTLTPEFVWLP